jgi:cation:H+ antiporter
MARHMDWVFLVASLLIILVAAELFTNGIEWVGEGFGLSEGAVGSVLAAIGTALPETLLPIVAIVSGHEAGDEIGIGAILGAPFMLTTLAMVVIGVAVLFSGRGGRRSLDLRIDRRVIQQDLGYFLVMYALAMVAGLLHVRTIDVCLAIVLVVGYGYYVRRHFQSPQPENEGDGNDIRPLRLWVVLRMGVRRLPAWTVERSTAAPFVQVAIGLILMVGGAKLFVASGATRSENASGGRPAAFPRLPTASTKSLAPPTMRINPMATWTKGAAVERSTVHAGSLRTPIRSTTHKRSGRMSLPSPPFSACGDWKCRRT